MSAPKNRHVDDVRIARARIGPPTPLPKGCVFGPVERDPEEKP